jgi:hypothetical protein
MERQSLEQHNVKPLLMIRRLLFHNKQRNGVNSTSRQQRPSVKANNSVCYMLYTSLNQRVRWASPDSLPINLTTIRLTYYNQLMTTYVR